MHKKATSLFFIDPRHSHPLLQYLLDRDLEKTSILRGQITCPLFRMN